ncbi:MAG TPA: VCBS repeat-containing protein, partial [Terriglobales bacterium]|nr:VCBS repeat-containing protein [Terriglobales bacterium]
KSDLIVSSGSPAGEGAISILLGNGNGTFRKSSVTRNLPESVSIVVRDFNGDGNQDVVTADLGGPAEFTLLLGNGDGSFQLPQNFGGPAGASSVVAGDFNHDGAWDLALVGVSNNIDSVAIALNTHASQSGPGSFVVPK